MSVGFFWWETLLFRKTLFPIFGRWTTHFRPSGKTFEPGRGNCILRVHKNNLRRKIFCQLFLYGFQTRSEKLSAFPRFFSDRIVKTSFYMSGGTFWIKNTSYWSNFAFSSFSKLEQKIFSLLAKVFGRVFKTAFYVSIGFFWWKTLLLWKTFFPVFGRWTKCFRPACKSFWQGYRKLHSTCPWEDFVEEN